MAGNPKIVQNPSMRQTLDSLGIAQYQLNSTLFEAISAVESTGTPGFVGKNGEDFGLMQVKNKTQKGLELRYEGALAGVANARGQESVEYELASGALNLLEQLRIIDVYANPKSESIREKYAHLGFNGAQHSGNVYIALRGYKDGINAIQNHGNTNAQDDMIYPEKVASYLLFRATTEPQDSPLKQEYLASFNRIAFDAMRSGHGTEFEQKLARGYQFYLDNKDFEHFAQNAPVLSFSEATAAMHEAQNVTLAEAVSPSQTPDTGTVNTLGSIAP